jgi:hypothetical protein
MRSSRVKPTGGGARGGLGARGNHCTPLLSLAAGAAGARPVRASGAAGGDPRAAGGICSPAAGVVASRPQPLALAATPPPRRTDLHPPADAGTGREIPAPSHQPAASGGMPPRAHQLEGGEQ